MQVHGDISAGTGGTAVGQVARDLHIHHPAPQSRAPVPQQLRSAPGGFVGRADQLSALDRALITFDTSLPESGRSAGGTAVISAIGGAGGIGKTWLALTWAHRNLHHFPDGQLSVDLRGFSPTGEPKATADALADFLAALGVDRSHQPQDLDDRAALYRTHTTGKRLLILLDNAASDEDVVPLLPGGNTCTVVVTSRYRLTRLVTRHGANPVRLDALADDEARTLLHTALGDTRIPGAEQAITELIRLCGGFPLALGLIAARIRTNPELVDDITAELRELGISALDDDDPESSLPAVLSWSLRHLTEQHRTAFALLGIAPGPDIGLQAAAGLVGLPAHLTRALLRELTNASLIDRSPGARWAMHDLIRAYAVHTAHRDLTDEQRQAALKRVTGHYLHTAYTAALFLNPRREPIQLEPLPADTAATPLSDRDAAMAWFENEHRCLLAVQHTAISYRWHRPTWQLAWTLNTFHHRRGHRYDRLAAWQAAAAAAEHLNDPATLALVYSYLGRAHANLGDTDRALQLMGTALALIDHTPREAAYTHQLLCWVWGLRGDDERALSHATYSLGLYRELADAAGQSGETLGEASALNMIGSCEIRLGQYERAREHCLAAVAIHQHIADPDGEASSLDNLARLALATGSPADAITYYTQALNLRLAQNNSYAAADTCTSIGHAHVARSEHHQARLIWRQALELYRDQGREHLAAQIQRQLDQLDQLNKAADASTAESEI